jgi:hypothetical protein
MNPGRMPHWERDFWATLMEDQGVFYKSGPEAFTYEDRIPQEPFVSPYATEDMLIGEIVEEEPLCINP